MNNGLPGKRELEKRAGITMCFLPKIFEYQAFAIADLKPFFRQNSFNRYDPNRPFKCFSSNGNNLTASFSVVMIHH